MPGSLGGKGGATNPEQLFAAGYAACFGNAVIHVTRNQDKKIRDNDVEVDATGGLSPTDGGGFALTVALDVTIAGVDQATAEEIVARSEEHTSELQSLMRISYAVFCLEKQTQE